MGPSETGWPELCQGEDTGNRQSDSIIYYLEPHLDVREVFMKKSPKYYSALKTVLFQGEFLWVKVCFLRQ